MRELSQMQSIRLRRPGFSTRSEPGGLRSYLQPIALTLTLALLLAGCSKPATESLYVYLHDTQRPDLAKLYLVDDSRGRSITIHANDTLIWKGVVGKSGEMPNIHEVGIPPGMQRGCRLRVSGGPYDSERDVDWQRGKALIVHLADDRVVFTQKEEPVGFQ
jgi:hypothetical protein